MLFSSFPSIKTNQLLAALLFSIVMPVTCIAQDLHKIDSLKKVIDQSIDDTIKAQALLLLGIQFVYAKSDTAMLLAEQGLKLSEKLGYTRGISRAYHLKAGVYYYMDKYDSAITLEKLAIKSQEQLKDTIALASRYNNLAVMYTSKGDYLAGIKCYLQSYEYSRAKNDKRGMARSCQNIGQLNRNLENFQEALKYHTMANSIAEEIGYAQVVAASLSSIGYVYLHLEEYEKTIAYCDRALEIAREEGFLETMSESLKYMGEAYMKLNAYEKAEDLIQESLQITTTAQATGGSIESLNLMAMLKLKKGRFSSALDYSKQAFELSKEIENIDLLYESSLILTNVFKAQQDYSNAFDYYQVHNTYKDSLFDMNKVSEIAALQVKYETEKQQQDIEILEQKSEIQTLQMAKQQNLLWIFVSAVIILSIFIILLYNLFRIRQREKDRIQQKNEVITEALEEKGRLIKEIHHRVKNNLQIIQSILDTQSIELKDESAVAALQESKSRVQTISLIHQYLYKTQEISLDIQNYLRQLVDYIQHSLWSTAKVTIYQSVESFRVDAEHAVSLGLIINETLTNALKHGFKDRVSGEVHLVLKKLEEDRFVLEISDNGTGLPGDFDDRKHHSMGFRLIEGLTKHLGGTLKVIPTSGTTLRFMFPLRTLKLEAA